MHRRIVTDELVEMVDTFKPQVKWFPGLCLLSTFLMGSCTQANIEDGSNSGSLIDEASDQELSALFEDLPAFDESFIKLELTDPILTAGRKYRFGLVIPIEARSPVYVSVVNGTIYANDEDGMMAFKPAPGPFSCITLYRTAWDSIQVQYGQRCFPLVSPEHGADTASP